MQCSFPQTDTRVSSVPNSPGLDPDTHIVFRIANGDSEAVAELYGILWKLLVPQIRYRLRGQEPDDVLHEALTIVVLCIRKGELRCPEKLRGYSLSVARRLIAGRIQNEIRSRRTVVSTDETLPNLLASGNPEWQVLNRERGELVRKALKQLHSRDSELITRFYIEGQPHTQICDDMHLTETQFRLFKSRAKAKLTEWARTHNHTSQTAIPWDG